MIRSMTGYGSAELEREGQRLSAEVRSVNHRFCEVSIRAPKLVSLFEDQIRQLVQERFSRGKITISISWSGVGETGEVLSLNLPVVERYVSILQQLRDRYRPRRHGLLHFHLGRQSGTHPLPHRQSR